MEKSEVSKIIIEIIKEYFESQDIKEKATEETVLFGKNSVLDSLGLVNVIIDIESKFLDEGYEILLTSEKAMSRSNSPFRAVETLSEYIIAEQMEGDDE